MQKKTERGLCSQMNEGRRRDYRADTFAFLCIIPFSFFFSLSLSSGKEITVNV